MAYQESPEYRAPHDPGCESITVILTLDVVDLCGLTDQDVMLLGLMNIDQPGITVEKTIVPPHDTTPPNIGDVVTYSIEVTNTGNMSLIDIEVVDETLGWSAQIASLLAGETSIHTASGALPDSALYGPFTNIVTATAFTACGSVEAEASRTVPWQNTPPSAEGTNLETCMNTPVAFDLVAHDVNIDADADPTESTFHHINFPIGELRVNFGAVTGNMERVEYGPGPYASVRVLYTPPRDFIGEDRVTFTVVDPYGEFALATVLITVIDCPDPEGEGGGSGLVVNEVAWAGTGSNAEHEWIELYNGSDGPVSLDGWVITWRRRQPETDEDWVWKAIELRGEIQPDGYFLIERYVDDAVSDIEADLVYGQRVLPDELRLSDLGEIIRLLDSEGRIVDRVNEYGPEERDGWPAGCLITSTSMPYATLERIDPEEGDFEENWSTNGGLIINGEDSERRLLTATARIINEETVLREILKRSPIQVAHGEVLTMVSALPSWVYDMDEVPQIHLIQIDRASAPCLARLVAFEEEAIEFVTIQQEPLSSSTTVNTGLLPLGEYQVWITLGKGAFHNLSMLIVEEEE